jgi:hypothetical protein
MQYYIYCLITCVVLLISCNKEGACPKTSLPDITTEGRNTFGCLIDGEPWSPHVEDSFTTPLDFGPIRTDYSTKHNYFNFWFTRDFSSKCDTIDQSLHFYVRMNTINDSIEFLSISHRDSEVPISYEDIDSTQNVTFEIIRFDKNQRIFSGIFDCTLLDEETGDRIKITDGRFDINY